MKRITPEILAASGPLLLTIGVGMTLGYSAVLLPQLQSPKNGTNNSENTIILSTEESSWVASLAALPMAGGTLLGGYLIQKFGRKMAHILTCLPSFTGWIIIYLAVNLEMLLTGRFLTGLCAGILAPATGVYIGETSEPKYRGVLLSGIALSVSVGLLLSHLLGTFLTWQTTALITSLLPILSCILMLFTPESPAWLAQKGCKEKAEQSFLWLRGGSEDARKELEVMLARQKQVDDERSVGKGLREFLAPEFLKPLGILVVFFITSQWAGVNAVNFYSVTLMKKTLGDGINEYLASFIIDFIRLLSSILACILIRKLGRRPLAIIGGLGTSLSLFLLSSSTYFLRIYFPNSTNLVFIPIASLILYITFVTAGFVTLPWNILGELLPLNKRSTGSGIASFVAYMSIFSVVKTMPEMFERLGPEGTFMVYGGMALFGTGFVYFCLPETKGKTLHEIEESFRKKKKDEVVQSYEKREVA